MKGSTMRIAGVMGLNLLPGMSFDIPGSLEGEAHRQSGRHGGGMQTQKSVTTPALLVKLDASVVRYNIHLFYPIYINN